LSLFKIAGTHAIDDELSVRYIEKGKNSKLKGSQELLQARAKQKLKFASNIAVAASKFAAADKNLESANNIVRNLNRFE